MRFFRLLCLALPLDLVLSTVVYADVKQSPSVCTVKANGHQKDDVPNILEAFHRCGNGGRIVFPEDETYWIGTRLNPIVNDVSIEWRGKWTVSTLHS
jgi:galacturan 1,4-alpha-galacturonidase